MEQPPQVGNEEGRDQQCRDPFPRTSDGEIDWEQFILAAAFLEPLFPWEKRGESREDPSLGPDQHPDVS